MIDAATEVARMISGDQPCGPAMLIELSAAKNAVPREAVSHTSSLEVAECASPVMMCLQPAAHDAEDPEIQNGAHT
jgi:hypothetical protein